MKHFIQQAFLLILASFCLSGADASEIIKIKLSDGQVLTGKLSWPANSDQIKEVIIFVHGTGPGTYDDHRKFGSLEFNYFDLFANEFNNRGIAFFTYNRRGVTIGNTPPYYDSVDMEKYRKYLPSVETEDIAAIISGLKLDKRLLNAKVVLLGWSEGTILAAMVADKKKSAVDALLLAGYANDNIFDIIRWQNSGEPSILNIKKYFDADHNGVISRQEYESTEKAPTSLRTGSFRNARFEQIDVDKDSVLSSGDFKIINGPRLKAIMDAYDRKDGDWIWKNYFRVTIEWLTEHQSLEANRTRLPRLEIPIYIFHGEDDANASVKGVYEIRDIFAEKQKSNLQCFVFKGHNHDLNFLDFPVKKTIPEGIQKIFEVAEELNK